MSRISLNPALECIIHTGQEIKRSHREVTCSAIAQALGLRALTVFFVVGQAEAWRAAGLDKARECAGPPQ